MKHGKKYQDSVKSFDNAEAVRSPGRSWRPYSPPPRQSLTRPSKVSARLGVDPRHADQQVRGAVVLPHGTGKKVRVLVFAKGDKAKEAQEAGADYRRRRGVW